MFLFFAASLLPNPDTPYRPTSTNAYTWLVSLGFEFVLAIFGSISQSILRRGHGAQNQHILYLTSLLLAYGRVLCLSVVSTIFFLPAKNGTDPATASLLGSESEESGYGTVPGTSSATTPVDAQTTNWLDYIVGVGKLLPKTW